MNQNRHLTTVDNNTFPLATWNDSEINIFYLSLASLLFRCFFVDSKQVKCNQQLSASRQSKIFYKLWYLKVITNQNNSRHGFLQSKIRSKESVNMWIVSIVRCHFKWKEWNKLPLFHIPTRFQSLEIWKSLFFNIYS